MKSAKERLLWGFKIVKEEAERHPEQLGTVVETETAWVGAIAHLTSTGVLPLELGGEIARLAGDNVRILIAEREVTQ